MSVQLIFYFHKLFLMELQINKETLANKSPTLVFNKGILNFLHYIVSLTYNEHLIHID